MQVSLFSAALNGVGCCVVRRFCDDLAWSAGIRIFFYFFGNVADNDDVKFFLPSDQKVIDYVTLCFRQRQMGLVAALYGVSEHRPMMYVPSFYFSNVSNNDGVKFFSLSTF